VGVPVTALYQIEEIKGDAGATRDSLIIARAN